MNKLVLTYTPKLYVCSCCGESKAIAEFYTQSVTGAPTNQCKQCINLKRSVQRNKRKHNKFISKERCRTGEEPTLTLKDWQQIFLHFKGCCAYCGKPEGRAREDKLDRDHLVAISKGGKTEPGNIVPACRTCNRGRGNKDWKTWYKQQTFYTAEMEARITAWEERHNVQTAISRDTQCTNT